MSLTHDRKTPGSRHLSPLESGERSAALPSPERGRSTMIIQDLTPNPPDDVAPLLGEGWRLLVDLTYRRHLVGTHLGISGLRVEPVLDPMRLHIGLIVKNARHCGC